MGNIATNSSLLRVTSQKLYLQLADLLRSQIRSGQHVPGAKLPPLDVIAEQFGVAVVTARQAIAILEKEGLVHRKQGRGTFVDGGYRQRNVWLRMESRWNTLVEKWEGIKPRIIAVRDHVPCPTLIDQEGTPAAHYHYMRRVHVAEGLPYAIVDIYLAEHVYKLSPKRFDRERVLFVLDSLPSIKVKHARETLTISTADPDTAQLLSIPLNSPVGAVRRTLRDQEGVLIYMADVIYRGDVVRIERNLNR
ncbi:MAG: GntR family transcriptional regulator [Burkholderiales bacterium]|nr:GntR family transcriptional regulator [Burkholderiales bacterium]